MPIFTPIKGTGMPKDFSLEHAQNLLDLWKKAPPATWKLTDEDYIITNGKIELRPGVKAPERPEEQG